MSADVASLSVLCTAFELVCADALAVPNPFWKGAAKVMLHKHTFNPQAAPPADDPTRPASTGWATAAQRHKETPPKPRTAADTFQLSDYLPAEQVFASVPKVPDNVLRALVKPPKRPKVQVSESLKLLLQSSAILQQQQQQIASKPAACSLFTSSQLSGSHLPPQAGVHTTAMSQIVLKKRNTLCSSLVPVEAKSAPGQQAQQPATSAQLGGPQLPGQCKGTAPFQGAKRPAIQAGSSVAPALLKRPKLAANVNPMTNKAGGGQSKGAASKGQAAGKPATAQKAPAPPKGPAKRPGPKLAPTTSLAQQAGQVVSIADAALAVPYGTTNGALGAAETTREAAAPQAASAVESVGLAAAAAAPSKAPRQRKKADDVDLAEVEKKIHDKQAAGRLQELSIPELKCFLKARKLPVGGKKADLLARMESLLPKA